MEIAALILTALVVFCPFGGLVLIGIRNERQRLHAERVRLQKIITITTRMRRR